MPLLLNPSAAEPLPSHLLGHLKFRQPVVFMALLVTLLLAGVTTLSGCGSGGSSTFSDNFPPVVQPPTSIPNTPPVVLPAVGERIAANVAFDQTRFAEGVSVDPSNGTLYLGTSGDSVFALLRSAPLATTFTGWLSATGILPGAPASGTLVAGTRVQGGLIYFCASTLAPVGKVWAFNLATQAKTGEYALPSGFCNDLAFDTAGNLFATTNRITVGAEAIVKLSAASVASGTSTATDWATWYTPPAGFDMNGLTFDAAGNRLIWADNTTTPRGTSRFNASPTSPSAASVTVLFNSLAVDVDGLQITRAGNLLAIDQVTGAKLISLGTGIAGNVSSLTGGAACATTVALYRSDAWCSDSRGLVLRLAGAGNL